MERMKARTWSSRGKMVLMKRMKAKKLSSRGKSGVQGEDESQKFVRKRKKWCSWRG
jgi:hypothetical protein